MDNSCFNHAIKLFVLALMVAQFIITPVRLMSVETTSTPELRPVSPTEYRVIEESGVDGRRRLAPFQLCLLCKCCAATGATKCVTVPCCFGIDCQLPNKPFGVCAFVPKTCNCTSCAV